MKIIRILLLSFVIPISWIYGFIIFIRNTLYNYKIKKINKFDKPIISIGNITTGGTCKTPLVIYTAETLIKFGKKPGIISRGYGRNSHGLQVVHNGKKIICEIEQSGDEPYLIAKTLNNIPVVVSENRSKGIKKLIDTFNSDIIIMDDGFQNRKIYRDLDIVTISANDSIRNYRILPWGKLREGINNINRSDYIIYTKTNNYKLPEIDKTIQPITKSPKSTSIIKPILMQYDQIKYKKTIAPDKPCFAFCGIADPNSFIDMAEKLSINICDKYFFIDHQAYNKDTIKKLSKKISQNATNNILTTEKDLFKLPKWFYEKHNVYIIKIILEFEKQAEINDKLKSIFID